MYSYSSTLILPSPEEFRFWILIYCLRGRLTLLVIKRDVLLSKIVGNARRGRAICSAKNLEETFVLYRINFEKKNICLRGTACD